MAIVRSAVVVDLRLQVSQRRKEQEARGSRPFEKLSWVEELQLRNKSTGLAVHHSHKCLVVTMVYASCKCQFGQLSSQRFEHVDRLDGCRPMAARVCVLVTGM